VWYKQTAPQHEDAHVKIVLLKLLETVVTVLEVPVGEQVQKLSCLVLPLVVKVK
jgi:hypothetical protein